MTVCVLVFTDVVDSTQLVARLGDARAAELWVSHDRHARQLLAQHRGREIDRSDGFFLLFDEAAHAARFALAYHKGLATLALSARVGIHAGPVTLRENAPDDVVRGAKRIEVEGLAKPLAARIMALARGGQTLMSAVARIALGEPPNENTEIARHGHYRLKGIEEPVEIFELGVRDLSPFTPPTDVDKAYRVIRAGDFWRPVGEVRHNLPPERDAFVGRIAELRALAVRLDTGTRLVTVLGPGGIGKTRFVRRFGRTWLGDWPGGVYFCDLSEARTRDGVLYAVASTLEAPLGKDDPVVQLGHAIAGRGPCLVILDNFEQVAHQAPATLGVWLDRAPEAAFVVTSRERLHLPGEVVFPIEPLPLEMDALELFATRARAQKPDFVLDNSNRAAVTQIVRLLDGMPLAIELAAARANVLSPAQIVERMRDRFKLLAGVRRPAARHDTLSAAIDWSWDLLTPWEQAAFAQCSVFDGGFSLEAAEAVLDVSAWADAPPVIDAVQALVDKSLLRVWRPKGSGGDTAEPFFGMYLSIHEYASQKLDAFGEQVTSDTEQRHGHYFAGFGSDDALDALLKYGGVARRQRLGAELDNLISACRRATRQRQPDIAAGCFLAAWAVFEVRGPFGMAAALGREVAGLDGLAPRLDAQVRIALSRALRAGGEIEQSDAVMAQALATARQAQDRRTEAMALRLIAGTHHRQGQIDAACQAFDTARALSETLADRGNLGALLANLANLQMELGRMAEARVSYEAALAIQREVGNRAAEGIALGNLGTLHHELGHAAEARAAYDAALLIHRETGSLNQEAITLCNLGVLDNEQGNQREAAAHYGASLKIHREIGERRGEGVVLGQIGELHQTLGEFVLAQANYQAALRIHREVGNLRFEGGVMGSLGGLLAGEGQIEAGLQLLEAGERLLRQVDDPLDLAKLLCVKGTTALAGGDADGARSALAEAESISAQLGAEPASDLGRQVETLRRALG